MFCDFGAPRRRSLANFCPKTDPWRLLFWCFFENGDFLKIMLTPRWEHNFRGSDIPKNGPGTDSKQQRQIFGLRPGPQNRQKTSPGPKKYVRRRRRKRLLSCFVAVSVRSRSPDRFLEGPTLENPIISTAGARF